MELYQPLLTGCHGPPHVRLARAEAVGAAQGDGARAEGGVDDRVGGAEDGHNLAVRKEADRVADLLNVPECRTVAEFERLADAVPLFKQTPVGTATRHIQPSRKWMEVMPMPRTWFGDWSRLPPTPPSSVSKFLGPLYPPPSGSGLALWQDGQEDGGANAHDDRRADMSSVIAAHAGAQRPERLFHHVVRAHVRGVAHHMAREGDARFGHRDIPEEHDLAPFRLDKNAACHIRG